MKALYEVPSGRTAAPMRTCHRLRYSRLRRRRLLYAFTPARRTAVVAAVLAAAVAAPGCASVGNLDAARVKDLECVDAQNAAFAEKNARSWIVVEGGEVAAISPAADDAVRAAAANRASSAPTPHRFVYRPADRGARLSRLAFLPEGGLVAGRQFLAGLGYRVASVGVAGVSPDNLGKLRNRAPGLPQCQEHGAEFNLRGQMFWCDAHSEFQLFARFSETFLLFQQ